MERIQPELNDYKCENFTPGKQYPYSPKSITDDNVNKKYDVIVIGAGISGLEAAHQLHSKNIDVMILEGRDRIGGRIFTKNVTGPALDYGGSWIHGLNKHSNGLENPIYKIALKNNIHVKETDEITTLYDPNGHQIDDKSYNIAGKFDRFAEKYAEKLTTGEKQKMSISDVANKYYQSTTDMATDERKLWNYTMQWTYDMEQAENTTVVTFANSDISEYYEDDDDNEAIFPEGYNQIVNCLAGGLTILHANVTKVDYRDETIKISTERGDVFETKYVVSTLPLSVLQNKTTKSVLFDPPFDQIKKTAINHLTMGTMDKTYVIFNDDQPPFWSSSTWINRISKDSEKYNIDDDRWQFFFNYHKYNEKPILLAFNTGKEAKNLELENDTTIKREVTKTLGIMFQRNITDSDLKITPSITKWSSDPLSGGSYTIIPVNGSRDDFDKIASPIDNKVFFAGEATNKYYYGTVHGGYIAGYRAAEEIVKVKDNQKKLDPACEQLDSARKKLNPSCEQIDSAREQLEHGIKSWDIVCKRGETLVGITSSDDVKCIKK